jgi:hypothetical protein
MGIPVLGKLPSVVSQQLYIKASSSGITLLKENAFRRRYTGNKFSAVDINGNLWVRASELQKHLREGLTKPAKKKARVETQAEEKNILLMNYSGQISGNLSTPETELLTTGDGLSTKVRTYKVNKREVRQRILAMLNTQAGKKELYFWTVSFPLKTPDATAYQMFNIWLTALRQYKMLRDYIWVAERQENGTVHFHIAIPHRMSVGKANGMMRATLRTFAKRGAIPNYGPLRTRNYNGVDIAKNRKTKRVVNFAIKKGSRALATYLTKYVTKNETEFTHLAWHNSRGYSSLFTGVTFSIPEFISNGWPALLNRAKIFKGEFFTFVPWAGDPPRALMEHLYQLNSYLQTVLN